MSAYDSNAAYEPPRRAYMAQRQPQVGAAYGSSSHQQYAYDEQHQQRQPAYQSGGYDYGYDQHARPQEQGYDNDDYSREYHRPPQHDYQRQGEREYDRRYQQRAPRGPPPPQHSRPSPSYRGPPPSSSTRDAPTWDSRQYQQHDQGQGRIQGQPSRDLQERHNAQAPRPRQDPARSSMDDWKAREKARMKQDATSPEGMPFDNAFPVFGDKKKKEGRDMAGTSDLRASEERPRTSNGPRQNTPHGNGYQSRDDMPMPPSRPDMDRQYSAPEFPGNHQYETSSNQRDAQYSYQARSNQPPDQQLTSSGGQEHPEGYPDQWPMVAGQSPQKRPPQRPSPQHSNERNPRDAPNPRAAAFQAPDQRRPPRQRAPPTLDTSQTHQIQRPVYTDHQPLSPANVPPRPSTSHGSRQPTGYQEHGALMSQPQSAIPHDSYNYPPRSWSQEQHARHSSLDDIYSGYAAADSGQEPKPRSRAPPSREQEIEFEMPDFDSAAPKQMSNPQKRMQSQNDTRIAPPLQRTQTAPPSQTLQPRPPPDRGHPQSTPLSNSAHDAQFNQPLHQQPGRRPVRGPAPRGPPGRGMTADGPEGDARAMPMQDRQYDMGYRHGPPPDPQYQSSQYDKSNSLPNPQPPYASEPQVRRSFDDARQLPIRQGPPQPQRFYQNGQPPRGAYSPQNPPGVNSVGQQGWAGPMNGSAPQQQIMRGPPVGVANGLPMNQQSNVADKASSPDALPHHPVPVRPGHAQSGQSQNEKPPPVRNYNHDTSSRNGPPQQARPSIDDDSQPITHAELERLRALVESTKSPKQELILVKKLVEAASVLANEQGRVDAKTAGKNRERFINEAYKRLRKIVSQGYPDAQFYLADCHGQGTMGLEVDTKEAFKLYQAAAKSGHAQAAYRTAVCCEMGPEAGGGTSKDYPKAVQWYRRAATLGDAAAMYKVGAVLLKGLLGQQRNIVEAVNWLKRGAEKADRENPHALHELAMLYESSNTNPEIRNKVVADDGYARELLQQAAQLGYKFSQFRLGQAYEYGNLGLPIDKRSSIACYTKAAAQGEHQAELALSGWYLTGAEGILEHSDTEAYLWARKAASSEPPLARAMFAMGYFTENGIGCPVSLDEARKWYGRAASQRFPKAIERLEELKRSGGKPGAKGATKPPPMSGKLTRKDQKRDEENCVMM